MCTISASFLRNALVEMFSGNEYMRTSMQTASPNFFFCSKNFSVTRFLPTRTTASRSFLPNFEISLASEILISSVNLFRDFFHVSLFHSSRRDCSGADANAGRIKRGSLVKRNGIFVDNDAGTLKTFLCFLSRNAAAHGVHQKQMRIGSAGNNPPATSLEFLCERARIFYYLLRIFPKCGRRCFL